MIARRCFLAGAAFLAAALGARAAAAPTVVPLWAGGAPGSEARKDEPEKSEISPDPAPHRIVYNIHNPSLTLFLPARPAAGGNGVTAVVIAPGGGHHYLSIDNEGNDLGEWLSARGIAGFVLKYRLAKDKAGGSSYGIETDALADTRRAIRLVRARAREWGIDPSRVGVLGFSAGGELASLAGTRFDAGRPDAPDPIDRLDCRPDFVALIYPGAHPERIAVSPAMPPAFMLCAADDKHAADAVAGLLVKYRAAGVPAEVHVFATGGHGFGMRHRPIPISNWPFLFAAWLTQEGLLAGQPLE